MTPAVAALARRYRTLLHLKRAHDRAVAWLRRLGDLHERFVDAVAADMRRRIAALDAEEAAAIRAVDDEERARLRSRAITNLAEREAANDHSPPREMN
jgi:hypothetical protein